MLDQVAHSFIQPNVEHFQEQFPQASAALSLHAGTCKQGDTSHTVRESF